MIEKAAARRLLEVSERARAASERPLNAKVHAYLEGGSSKDQSREQTPSTGEERRHCDRVEITSEVLVRRIGGFNFQVALKDVSRSGCRVEMLEPCEVDDSVIARFAHLEPLGSRVCWTRGVTSGLQFQTSVHPAVFDMLLARLSENASAPA